MRKLVGPFPGFDHRPYGAFVQGSDIDHQSAADRGDLGRLFDVVGHDGRSSAGQNDIGAVVHRYIIGDRVHQRRFGFYIFQDFFEHMFFPPFTRIHTMPMITITGRVLPITVSTDINKR
ncbi:hypothetical protein SDC9_149445 [bioreactor metagenome]|uniref:Uncharacterized protein n=1 Tax=bioreactor metagenome TaxID=1076179 RepID=A0A645EJS1_9ZZZZ